MSGARGEQCTVGAVSVTGQPGEGSTFTVLFTGTDHLAAGHVAGLFCAGTEETDRVIGERILREV